MARWRNKRPSYGETESTGVLPNPDKLLREAMERNKEFNEKRARVRSQGKNYLALTSDEVSKRLSRFEEQVSDISSNPMLLGDSERSNYQVVIDKVRYLRRQWLLLDSSLLSLEQASNLWELLETKLPVTFDAYERVAISLGHSNQSSYNTYPHLGLPQNFRNFLESATNQIREMKNPVQEKPSQAEEWSPFPQVDANEPDVAAKLESIEKLWVAAVEAEPSMDDKYLLEQIITRYIPETWTLYQRFHSSMEPMKARSKAEVLEQLDTIEKQLVDITDFRLQNDLDTMQIQSQFLKDKVLESAK